MTPLYVLEKRIQIYVKQQTEVINDLTSLQNQAGELKSFVKTLLTKFLNNTMGIKNKYCLAFKVMCSCFSRMFMVLYSDVQSPARGLEPAQSLIWPAGLHTGLEIWQWGNGGN